ncbi:3604_t:CDS:1, partial [Racocetra persica]
NKWCQLCGSEQRTSDSLWMNNFEQHFRNSIEHDQHHYTVEN